MSGAADRWIVIPRWEDFQHRDAARATVPTWVKDFTQQLSKDEYLALTWQQRGLLHDIRLEYARSKRQLHASTTSLSRRLGQTVRLKQLEALVDAGFIELSASKPASSDASNHASLEVEVEDKDLKDLDLELEPQGRRAREFRPYDPPAGAFVAVHHMILNGALANDIDLEAEIRGQKLGPTEARELREVLKKRRAA